MHGQYASVSKVNHGILLVFTQLDKFHDSSKMDAGCFNNECDFYGVSMDDRLNKIDVYFHFGVSHMHARLNNLVVHFHN
jgi:hypothetical protein